ncbi:MAG: efflux transporter outer membrane subunit [Phycisphaerae bacterium]
MNIRRFGINLICMAAVTGCSVGPNYRTPQTPTPKTWIGVKPAGPTTRPAGPTTRPANLAAWWKSLNDPILDSLLDEAMKANLDLRIATARVLQARGQRGMVASALWPQLNSSASHRYSGSSLNAGSKPKNLSLAKQARNTAVNSALQAVTGTAAAPVSVAGIIGQAVTKEVNNKLQGTISTPRDQNTFQAGFDASWELDVFGGTRRAVEAADDTLAASVEIRRDVLVTLLSEVALNYVQLRGSQRRLAIARANIQVQKDSVEITRTKYKAGFTNELDLDQAEAQLATTQSQIPLLETAIKQAIYQLSVLLARPPGDLLSKLEKEGPIPVVPPEVPVGLPSDLVRQRPDIRAAERQLAAATAQIGVATADMFPKFSITGSIGPQVSNINRILDQQSLGWSIGPGITWPVFDGWRIRSNIQLQNAFQEEALATYEKTVLIAFQDVENALVAYTNEQVRHKSLVKAENASRRATDLSKELYIGGLTPFLNVLQSEGTLYSTQDQLVQSETTVVTNLIALYKALGGGWEAPKNEAAINN